MYTKDLKCGKNIFSLSGKSCLGKSVILSRERETGVTRAKKYNKNKSDLQQENIWFPAILRHTVFHCPAWRTVCYAPVHVSSAI
jgi:hypothetical protein